MIRKPAHKGLKTWLDMVVLACIAVLASSVIDLVRGDFDVQALFRLMGLYFLVFLFWWLWLNRKRFCRTPRPA